jgi:hypothetical protein
MAILAVSLDSIECTRHHWTDTSHEIDLVRDWLQMNRVKATTVAAKVI